MVMVIVVVVVMMMISGAHKMAPWVKGLATEIGDLSSVPPTHIRGRQSTTKSGPLTSTVHNVMCRYMHTCAHTSCMHTHKKFKKLS